LDLLFFFNCIAPSVQSSSSSWVWMLPLGTHVMPFSFSSWALSLWSFFFCQPDEPSKYLGCAWPLDSGTFFLIFGSFNLFCPDLVFGISTAEFSFSLPLIAEVFNTLISFSAIVFRSELVALRPSEGPPWRASTWQNGNYQCNPEPEEEKEILEFLRKNQDVFTWSASDLRGVSRDIIEHRLYINPNIKSKKQKLRKMTDEKVAAVKAEVQRLLDANVIREVKYPTWLANTVPVKKKNGKWYMCIDFTDLNKACPKDDFPLPRIDRVVDDAANSQLMSLLDCFSGYSDMDEKRRWRENKFHNTLRHLLLREDARRIEECRTVFFKNVFSSFRAPNQKKCLGLCWWYCCDQLNKEQPCGRFGWNFR